MLKTILMNNKRKKLKYLTTLHIQISFKTNMELKPPVIRKCEKLLSLKN